MTIVYRNYAVNGSGTLQSFSDNATGGAGLCDKLSCALRDQFIANKEAAR
jgi:hypothetical protein